MDTPQETTADFFADDQAIALEHILENAHGVLRTIQSLREVHCVVCETIQTFASNKDQEESIAKELQDQYEQLERLYTFQTLHTARQLQDCLQLERVPPFMTSQNIDQFFVGNGRSEFVPTESPSDLEHIARMLHAHTESYAEVSLEMHRIHMHLQMIESNTLPSITSLHEEAVQHQESIEKHALPRQLYVLRTHVRQLLENEHHEYQSGDEIVDGILKNLSEHLHAIFENEDMEPQEQFEAAKHARSLVEDVQQYLRASEADRRQSSIQTLNSAQPIPNANVFNQPTLEDLRRVVASYDKYDGPNRRTAERLELCVPAEVQTFRGNTLPAMTREISRTGIGLLHYGMVEPGEVMITMASDSQEFHYRVQIIWCHPTIDGMYISGGRFLRKTN